MNDFIGSQNLKTDLIPNMLSAIRTGKQGWETSFFLT
jgi:hypothetical protein